MPKSKDAFRTISEVAEWLDVQPHVLRFWESKFSQVRPVKRAGGRRYYRPNDMLLIGGIKQLLHDDGMTIKGVQKLLREKGIKEISALSRPIDDEDTVTIEEIADPAPVTEADLLAEAKIPEEDVAEIEAVQPTQIEEEPSPIPEGAAPVAEIKTPRKPLAEESPAWEIRRKILARLTEIHTIDADKKPAIAEAIAALAEVQSKRQWHVNP